MHSNVASKTTKCGVLFRSIFGSKLALPKFNATRKRYY